MALRAKGFNFRGHFRGLTITDIQISDFSPSFFLSLSGTTFICKTPPSP